MTRENRRQQAVLAVWERSHGHYLEWPAGVHESVRPAACALLAQLRECASVDELEQRYWELGDPPGALLKEHLTLEWDDATVLVLEEACFWMRLRELRGERPDA